MLPFLGAIVLTTPLWLWVAFTSDEVSPILLVTVLTLLPFAIGIRDRRFDLLSPVYCFSVLFFLGYVVRTLYIMAAPDRFVNYELGHAVLSAREYLRPSEVLAALGLTSFYFGYYSLARLHRYAGSRLSLRPQRLPVYRTAAMVGIVGLLFFVMKIGSSDVGQFAGMAPVVATFDHLISLFSGLVRWAVMCFLIRSSSRLKSRYAMLIVVIASLAISLPDILAGSRGRLLWMFLGCYSVYHYADRHRSTRSIKPIGWAIVLLAVAFPMSSMIKQALGTSHVASTESTIGGRLERVKLGMSSFSSDFQHALLEAPDDILFRLRGIDSLMLAVKNTPEIFPYQQGRTYLSFFQAFVPRLFWPDKPATSVGREFNLYYIGVAASTPGSAATTPLAEFYMNFGVWGVFPGMAALGCLFAALYARSVATRQPSVIRVLLYSLVLSDLLTLENSLGATLSEFVMNCALLGVFVLVVFRRTSVDGASKLRRI
jgi:hypothetical protein